MSPVSGSAWSVTGTSRASLSLSASRGAAVRRSVPTAGTSSSGRSSIGPGDTSPSTDGSTGGTVRMASLKIPRTRSSSELKWSRYPSRERRSSRVRSAGEGDRSRLGGGLGLALSGFLGSKALHASASAASASVARGGGGTCGDSRCAPSSPCRAASHRPTCSSASCARGGAASPHRRSLVNRRSLFVYGAYACALYR